jgi:hypothetical protein
MTSAVPDPLSPVSKASCSHELVQHLLPVALALSVGTAVAVAAVALYRLGFADSPVLQIGVLLSVLAGIWLPLAALALRVPEGVRALYLAMAFTTVLWWPAAGLVAGRFALAAGALVLLGAWVVCRRPLAGVLTVRLLLRSVGAGLLVGAALVVAGSAGRYQMPEAVALGLAHSDQYFHMAIAQMIAHFGVPSIGGDGLVLQRYHFGSHLVAAGLSEATGGSPALVYVYWGTLALKVHLLWALVCAAAWFSRRDNHVLPAGTVVLHVLAYLFIGRSFLESESFMFALALFIGALPLMVELVVRRDTTALQYRLALVGLVLVVFLCALGKISVGFYGAVVLAWIAWRNPGARRQQVGVVVALGLLLAITWRFLRPDELSLLEAGASELYYSYLQYLTLSTLVTFAAPALILVWPLWQVQWSAHPAGDRALSVWQLQMHKPAGWRVLARRFGDVGGFEQVVGIFLVASVVVLFTVPVGSNVAYFTGVVLFVCACRVPVWFGRWSAAVPLWCRRHWALSSLAVLLMLTTAVSGFLKDFARSTGALVRAEARQATYWDQQDLPQRNTALVLERIRLSLRDDGTLFGTTQTRMAQLPWAAILRDVATLRHQGARVAVHVPPANQAFWHRLQGGSPYWCISAHLMIPAQLGVPMLRGIGPQELEKQCLPGGQVWYGFGRQQDVHRSTDLNGAKLCSLALQGGFNSVYVLEDIWNPLANRVLTCRAGQEN